jgi:hypothetical protein
LLLPIYLFAWRLWIAVRPAQTVPRPGADARAGRAAGDAREQGQARGEIRKDKGGGADRLWGEEGDQEGQEHEGGQAV